MADESESWDPDRIAYTLDLTPAELKLTYSALRSLLDDFGHDERDVADVVKRVIAKLPDEHSIRAIDLRSELGRRPPGLT
jgi:hypothetical protein